MRGIDDSSSAPVFLDSATARRYTILGGLGGGGMGEVYLARDERLDRRVAVKVVRQDLMDNRNLALRFEREVRGLARLNHPNLIRIYDFHDEGSVRFYTMELVEGETLSALVKEGWLDALDGAEVVAQAAEGLAHAHERGLVHRDVKPSNVLLTRQGVVKVLDFGLVRFAQEFDATTLTASGLVVGTLRYLPPEAFCQQVCGPSADVWQLGVLLYRILTGLHPVGDAALDDMVSGAVFLRLESPRSHVPGLDAELDALTMSALSLDPTRRPTAEAMARSLRAWLEARTANPRRELKPVMDRWESDRKEREARAIEAIAAGEAPRPGSEDTTPMDRGGGASWTNPFKRLDGQALSWRDVLIRAGSEALPEVTPGGAKTVALGLGLALLVLALLYGVFDAGALFRRDPDGKLDGTRFTQIELVSPDRLRLRFTGLARGRWLLRLKGSGLDPAIVPAPVWIDLATSRVVSRRHRELDALLSPPLTRSVQAELTPPGGGESASRGWSIDPERALDRALAPVDALHGEALVSAMTELGRLRQSWERMKVDGSWKTGRDEARKTLAALLARHGLDEGACECLRQLIPAYLEPGLPPGDRRARRLLPLRHLEAMLTMGQGIRPPWGLCAERLGHAWAGEVDAPPLAPGWRRWRELDFVTEQRGRTRWVWLADRPFVANLTRASPMTQALFFGQILPDLLRANEIYDPKGESYPENSLELGTVHAFVVDVRGDELDGLGPRDARLWLRVKMQDRAFALVCRINGEGPAMILATGALADAPVAARSRPHWLSLPLDARRLRKGSNSLSLTVEVIPALSSTYPMAIEKGEIQIRDRGSQPSPATDTPSTRRADGPK